MWLVKEDVCRLCETKIRWRGNLHQPGKEDGDIPDQAVDSDIVMTDLKFYVAGPPKPAGIEIEATVLCPCCNNRNRFTHTIQL